jgi:hypothetical protein
MMSIELGFDNGPLLTPHEAVAIALLLGAIGTDAALTLAPKLNEKATTASVEQEPVMLGEDEKRALLEALEELCEDLAPERILLIRRELAADLGLDLR